MNAVTRDTTGSMEKKHVWIEGTENSPADSNILDVQRELMEGWRVHGVNPWKQRLPGESYLLGRLLVTVLFL